MTTPARGLLLALAFVAAVCAVFVWRGPMRELHGALDFAAPYAGSIAWRRGLDPYDPRTIQTLLAEAGREPAASPQFTPALYPGSALLLLTPLSMLPWSAARVTWMLVGLVLLAFEARALVRLAGARLNQPAGVLALAAIFALAPYSTAFGLGQIALATTAFIVIGVEQLERGNEMAGGASLALAALLKPHTALAFVLYYALRGRWRATFTAVALGAAILGAALLWMRMRHVDWLSTWLANSGTELRTGGTLDPTGPLSAQMVDLRPLLASVGLPGSAWLGTLVAALLAVALFAAGRALPREHDLLIVSGLSAAVLLSSYHRFYDAALLSLPLTYAIRRLSRSERGIERSLAWGMIACCLPFCASGAWALQKWSNEGRFAGVSHTLLWDAVVLRHQTWALLMLTVVAIAIVRRVRRVRWSGEHLAAVG